MTAIKKQYVELIELLEASKNKKVSTILEEVKALCEAKKGGSDGKTFEKDADGNVTKVYCWYHKQWEDVAEVEYGNKKGTATGLNTMCKQGVSSWTKQQRIAKQARDEVLTRVASGEELNVQDELDAIEVTRQVIIERK